MNPLKNDVRTTTFFLVKLLILRGVYLQKKVTIFFPQQKCFGDFTGGDFHLRLSQNDQRFCYMSCPPKISITTNLVDDFNPFEKYESKWVHLPQMGLKLENISNRLKPSFLRPLEVIASNEAGWGWFVQKR